MDLRHLRAFHATMTTGSTVGAARALAISQSSVSRLLSEFETARGETLFVRAGGRLVARQAAEGLMPQVERILSEVGSILRPDASDGLPLRLAAPGGLVTALFAPACRALSAAAPGLRFSVEILSYHETLSAVALGRVDLGIVKAPFEHPAVEERALVEVGSEVILRRDDPLAGRDVVRAEDLAGRPLVLLGRNRPFRVRLDEALAAAGVAPQVAIETHAVSAACAFVREGAGVTVANALLARCEAQGMLVSRPFVPRIEHRFSLVHGSAPLRPRLLDRLARELRDAALARLADAE